MRKILSLCNTKNVLEKIARDNNCLDKYQVWSKSHRRQRENNFQFLCCRIESWPIPSTAIGIVSDNIDEGKNFHRRHHIRFILHRYGNGCGELRWETFFTSMSSESHLLLVATGWWGCQCWIEKWRTDSKRSTDIDYAKVSIFVFHFFNLHASEFGH